MSGSPGQDKPHPYEHDENEVLVSVDKHDTVPSVGFPAAALFGVETGAAEIAEAVNRARGALDTWR